MRAAAGRTVQADSELSHAQYSFDGDGRLLKTTRTRPRPTGGTITTSTYYLNSTVLGRLAVAELNGNGQRTKRYIYAGRRKLAHEAMGAVTWSHADPVTSGRGDSAENGVYHAQAEFNADGINVGFEPPVETGFDMPEPIVNSGLLALDSGCSVADPNCQTCYLDGFEHDCGRINWEAAEQCPNNDCGPRRVPDANGNPVLAPLTRNPNNGLLGYWPDGYNAPGVIHNSMGQPIRISPDGPHAPGGGGTPIYGAFRVDVAGGGMSITGEWEYYVVGYSTPFMFGSTITPQNTYPSGCERFVDNLMEHVDKIGASVTQRAIGGAMALEGRSDLADQARAGKLDYSGFKEKFIDGGQNGWAMVHIQGVAGASLAGNISAINKQFSEDKAQLKNGLDFKAMGRTTIPYAGRSDYPIDKYIAEKRAEIEDDHAGVQVAGFLSDKINGKATAMVVRDKIFNFLCDK